VALHLNDHTARKFKSLVYDNSIVNFVETGTNLGVTIRWLAKVLQKVGNFYTIEMSEHLHNFAKANQNEKIAFILGNSAEEVPKLAQYLNAPTLWYLDAHYCEYTTHEVKGHFPLWSELAGIRDKFSGTSIIWIDDVSNFGVDRSDLGDPWIDVSIDGILGVFEDRVEWHEQFDDGFIFKVNPSGSTCDRAN
jgi:hypothetical protein